MSRGAIPLVRTGQPALDNSLLIMKQHLDRMTGSARDSRPIGRLGPDPTNAEIAIFLNRLADLLGAR